MKEKISVTLDGDVLMWAAAEADRARLPLSVWLNQCLGSLMKAAASSRHYLRSGVKRPARRGKAVSE